MKKQTLTTKELAYCALLAALSVVLARMIIPMPNASTRFSIEAIPIFMAGMLFGPVAGALVGFCADFVGCLFSAFGYNPLFSLPPVLYGLFGGIFQAWLRKGVSIPRLTVAFAFPVVVGSILYQSAALAFVYNSKGNFGASLIYFLTTRSVQFAVTMVLDIIIIYVLFRSKMFDRMGLWHSCSERKERNQHNDG